VTLPPDAIDRLRLARTHLVGPVSYRQLVARFGSAGAALAALPDLVRRSGGRAVRIAELGAVEAEIERVQRLGGIYLFLDSDIYPNALGELANAPIALMARGDIGLLARPAIAMVGARNSSAASCRFARQLAADLGERGHVVVSGLARGIDTAAHQGAMAHGTIGVIASGLDIAFPPENKQLQQDMSESQLVLTEYPPGTEPLARQFPHRNRIIAGLTAGTVVVEAAPRSGSLLTARMATEAGREVMAVPGHPLDPRAQGCNQLIREGATLVQSAADIIEAVSHIDPRAANRLLAPPADWYEAGEGDPDDEARTSLTNLLGPVAVGVDELVRQSGMAAPTVHMILLELELAGRLERHAAGRVSLAH
jgi:DNA processing protein